MSKALNKVAQQLSELNRRVGGLERSRSLSRSTIVDGAIRTVELVPTEEYDEFGNPIYEERVIGSIGKQPDGGWATVVNEGPIPSTPVPPDVVGGLGWLSVRWTGGFVDGLPPTSDHHSVEVHVAPEHEQDKIGTEETLHGAFGLAGGTHTVTSLDAGHYIVGLVSVSTAGKRSPISLYTEGDISEGPTAVEVVDMNARIDEASQIADEALSEAQNALAEALKAWEEAEKGTTDAAEALSRVATAQEAAQSAQDSANDARSTANSAQDVADAAAQAAAAAAGLGQEAKDAADSKADVLIQSTTPASTYRRTQTLWIDTTGGNNTPKRWDGSTSIWVEVTDKAAKDAAAAAVEAQNVAEAARDHSLALRQEHENLQAQYLGTLDDLDALEGSVSIANGKITVHTRNPTAADAVGKELNSLWEVRSGSTVLRRYLLTGTTTWTQVKLGQDFIGDNAIGSAQIIDAAIGTAQIADASITDAKIGSLNVAKLVADTARMDKAAISKLIGDAAWFGELTAGRLLIGNSENLIPNGDLAQGGVAPWKLPLQVDTTDAPTGLRASLVTPPGQPTIARVNGDDSWITVKPGSKLRFEIWLKADKPGSKFYLELRDEANNHAGSMIAGTADAGTVQASTNGYLVNNTTLKTAWTKYTGTYQLNDGISQVRLGTAYFNHSDGSERQATVWLAGARLTPMVGAVQIEDGAITTPKITATSDLWTKLLTVAGDATVGGNLIVNDTIDASKLRVDELFAQTIAGNIATFQEAFVGKLSAQSIISETFQGYRIEGAEIVSSGDAGNITISDNTMVVQRNLPDGDGSQVTMRLGGSESDQFSLTPAGSPEATVFMDGDSGDANFAGNVSMNDLRVGGTTLSEMLDPRPRGIIGMTWGSGASLPDVGSNSYGLVRFTWAIESGRKYLFGADVKVQGTPGDKIQFTLHHSAALGPTDISSATLSIWYYEIPIGGVGSVHLERPIQMSYSHPEYNVLLSMRNWSTSTRPVRLWSDAGSAQSQSYFWIEDKGKAATEASAEWVTDVGRTFGDTVAPPAPEPTKRTYTKTYQASGAWSWRSGSPVWDSLQHGEESGAYRQSQILFPPSVVSDLDGATLLKARLKMRNTHTWYGSGMTVLISTWSHSAQQSSPPTSATNQSVKWGRGETKFVTLNNFAKGQRSVWLGIGAPGGNEHFGRFSRTLSDLVLELTYEK